MLAGLVLHEESGPYPRGSSWLVEQSRGECHPYHPLQSGHLSWGQVAVLIWQEGEEAQKEPLVADLGLLVVEVLGHWTVHAASAEGMGLTHKGNALAVLVLYKDGQNE